MPSPPGAAASSEKLNVNPSTGYATPAPPPGETVHVNPSTGYASVGQPSTTPVAATPRSIETPTAAEASSGFDWGSAGIGAAAGAGLVLMLTLSAATVGVGGRGAPGGSARAALKPSRRPGPALVAQ